MNRIHHKFIALAVIAVAGLVVDSAAMASETDDEGAVPADPGSDFEIQASQSCSGVTQCTTPRLRTTRTGTITIRADAWGGPEIAHWYLFRDGVQVCRQGFPAEAPEQDWMCYNMPAGYYSLEVVAGRTGERVKGTVSGL
ncbi:hypothetical protein LZC95_27005 [Pendulispora brunnea]|uniref:Uncharacterized protein n=1 Tax=Pendulispora brunnea TaxID=2905690 RepID=A0ABZ2JYS6_9BACT